MTRDMLLTVIYASAVSGAVLCCGEAEQAEQASGGRNKDVPSRLARHTRQPATFIRRVQVLQRDRPCVSKLPSILHVRIRLPHPAR
jgi:hypothetical protein